MENNDEKCKACGDGVCVDCGSCHACKGGVCARPAGHGVGRYMRSRSVRYALIAALAMLALWAGVEAISGMKAYGYIGSGINPTNTISVQGEGKVFSVPDTAQFSFTISETDSDVASAQETVNKKADDIIGYLKSEAGVEDRDIKTESYNASPKYEYTDCPISSSSCTRSSKIVGYTVSETVSVKVRNTDKAGDVLSNVGSRGVSNVSGLSFVVDDEKLLMEQARGKAITEAQGRAEQLAKDLGVSLVRVVGYYENSSPYYSKAYGMGGDVALESAAAPRAANIQLGENTIEANVTVTYEIR